MSKKSKKEKKRSKDEAESAGEEEAERVSDGWVTLMILAILLSACLSSWWLAKQEAVPGAPGAPVGGKTMQSSRLCEPAPPGDV